MPSFHQRLFSFKTLKSLPGNILICIEEARYDYLCRMLYWSQGGPLSGIFRAYLDGSEKELFYDISNEASSALHIGLVFDSRTKRYAKINFLKDQRNKRYHPNLWSIQCYIRACSFVG